MWTLFLLFLLDLTNFSQALDFWTYHVDNPKTKVPGGERQYCNVMMRQRGLVTRRHCSQFNTFIHETNNTIINICANPTETCESSRWVKCNESSRALKVTYCFTKSYAWPPNCGYKAKIYFANIKVICVNGLPVYMLPS
ncbi:ribonuclease-like [Petaurus breviceps papuanus]|uniref:ribonuclease-like n=1 Tax=Petaurus breviceps papuanus TaxID=3040969 RepID=UPI0036D94DDB